MPEPKITILTATLNAAAVLPRLIASLRAQTDADFVWVIADGGSTDESRMLLADCSDLQIRIDEAADFGIYDALNRGLRLIADGYYLVVGADDTLAPDAIENYRRVADASGQPDFVAAGIEQGGRSVMPRKNLGWLYGMPGVASSHSVGLLVKRSCHDRFGLYSRRFPITADQLFVKQALQGGASIAHARFIAGEFSIAGTSGADSLGLLTELFRVQVRTERFVALQYLLFATRLTKYFVRSLLSGRGGR
ncbi:MAG: glycosyltransferase [Burkholderiaceae bacterium]|nr:glycosyltransferase [Burkholderiaceae bacterium]